MRRRRLFLMGLLLLTAWLYRASLHFGYIWDDPLFFGRLADRSLLALMRPIPGFYFYRPGVMLYNRLFAGADGLFHPFAHHAAQLGWHLINISIVYALARRLRLSGAMAATASLLFALHPFAHQAVAWTQAQHPLVTTLQLGSWLAFLQAVSWGTVRPFAASLLFFTLALTLQESTVPQALVPLLLLWAIRDRMTWSPPSFPLLGDVKWSRVVFLFPLLAALYTLIWYLVPRPLGNTIVGRELLVAEYVLQAFMYPFLGRPAGYPAADTPGTQTLVLAGAGALSVVVMLRYALPRRSRPLTRVAIVTLLWALLGVSPALAGLPYSYVKLGPRLAYVATPGITIFWAVTLTARHRTARLLSYAAFVLVALQSVLLIQRQQEMWQRGTMLQRAMIEANLEKPERPQLYVNYPDRYALRRPSYPLGYWGVTLAPVVQQLNDYAELEAGNGTPTTSLYAPWHEAPARAAAAYEIDYRGRIVFPDELYAAAVAGDELYLVRSNAGGAFDLSPAGRRLDGHSYADCLVTFGDSICLTELRSHAEEGRRAVSLTWQFLAAAEATHTVFLHLGEPGQPPAAQSDGDLWLGLLPLAIPDAGDTVQEWRYLDSGHLPPGEHTIGVGVYRRDTGERLPAFTPEGDRLPDDVYFPLFR